ncbi:MAG: Na+/H+ antiporter subunit E [Planctomycetota bacterium]
MILFLANILLALLWASTIGPFTMMNFLSGFILGFFVLYMGVPSARKGSYFTQAKWTVRLGLFFIKELIVANVKMVILVLGPIKHLRPAIIRIPLEPGLSDLELTALANMITLTPGTLSLDISKDRKSLFVHFMHAEDPDAEIKAIKEGFERRITEVTRCAA